MGRVIVSDQMEGEVGRRLAVDLIKKTDKLLMPVARHAVADHLAVKHAQCRKQGGRAMAFVVMRHGSASAALEGSPGLGPVECLDLTFLVDAQHQGFVWRIQIESHDIGHRFQEVLVAAELERFHEVRLEIVSRPDALNGCLAEVLCRGHAACTPVGCGCGGCVERGLNHGVDFALWDFWYTAGTGCVLL